MGHFNRKISLTSILYLFLNQAGIRLINAISIRGLRLGHLRIIKYLMLSAAFFFNCAGIKAIIGQYTLYGQINGVVK